MTQRKIVQNMVKGYICILQCHYLTILITVDAMNIFSCNPPMVYRLSLLSQNNTDLSHFGHNSGIQVFQSQNTGINR